MRGRKRFFERMEDDLELIATGVFLAWLTSKLPPKVQFVIRGVVATVTVIAMVVVALVFLWAVLSVMFSY